MNILIYYIKKYILGALISLYGNRRLIGPNISRTEPKIKKTYLIFPKTKKLNKIFWYSARFSRYWPSDDL